MDTYYGCHLITHQKTFHCAWRREGRKEWRGRKKGRREKHRHEKKRVKGWLSEDEPCICVVDSNAWGTDTVGGEWGSSLTVRMGWALIWPASCFFFFWSRVYKHTQQARKRGRVQARGGYKLPVIDAHRRGGRQLKTRGAHRWPSPHPLLPFSHPLPPQQLTISRSVRHMALP